MTATTQKGLGTQQCLGWLGIIRLGLVQAALGAIVVLTTSTLNRVMVVELALPAVLPAILVGGYYAVQVLRPFWGFGSDMGGKRTPWIIGGVAVLALGGVGAAGTTVLMGTHALWGAILALPTFMLIGFGAGAAGTSLLALLATAVQPERRAAAASITWITMILGFVVTSAVAGALLDPFSGARLITVSAGVSAVAFLLAVVAVWGVEASATRQRAPDHEPRTPHAFMAALRDVWREPRARRFTVFVFLSMLAYAMQDLILEPFAGLVFGLTPGQSTTLASFQHGGVLLGMILVAVAASRFSAAGFGARQGWVIGGCVASAVALVLLIIGGFVGPGWPLRANVMALGVALGAFSVAAIGLMMGFASVGRARREGMRMGLWGAAQAISFGIGGFVGAAALDLARVVIAQPEVAFAIVFALEAVLFLFAARLALALEHADTTAPTPAAASLAA